VRGIISVNQRDDRWFGGLIPVAAYFTTVEAVRKNDSNINGGTPLRETGEKGTRENVDYRTFLGRVEPVGIN
jgi:hypothetical protein